MSEDMETKVVSKIVPVEDMPIEKMEDLSI